jgi:hypothetical protein
VIARLARAGRVPHEVKRLSISIVLAGALALGGAASADAKPSVKKAIWGPVSVNGRSQFPIYRSLGAGIYEASLSWATVAPTRPGHPADPTDPAYRWPASLDYAVGQARKYGITVSVLLTGAPPWANGNRSSIWAPGHSRDFANFAAAASKRYPGVHRWMIWGEPSKASRFQPLVKSTGRHISARQKRGPRLYARILDASYAALKHVSRHNIVIGGDTWTGGEVTPLNFIKSMRLPNGKRPRMDLYGHNPFTARSPDLRKGPIAHGYADFSDLDTLAGWLDRYGYRTPKKHRRLRLFLSELVIPTDHKNDEFNFWVDRATQASWLRAALRITRRSKRIATLGYLGLYDDPPRPEGWEVDRGLLDYQGHKKPAYRAYQRG